METIKPTIKPVVQNENIQRLSAYEYSYHFIKEHEGIRLQAYPDHKQRSICFGTKSYPWETTTLEDCYNRYKVELEPRVNKILKEYPNKNTCQQAALVSLWYNCPSCYRNMSSGLNKSKWLSMVYASGKKQWWLVKRRIAERWLYTKCD